MFSLKPVLHFIQRVKIFCSCASWQVIDSVTYLLYGIIADHVKIISLVIHNRFLYTW